MSEPTDFGDEPGDIEVAVLGRVLVLVDTWSIARSTAGRYMGDLGGLSWRQGAGMCCWYPPMEVLGGEVCGDEWECVLWTLRRRSGGWWYIVGVVWDE